MRQALENNFTLKSAYSRLQAARALARRESASLFPDLDGTFSANTTKSDATDTETFELEFGSSYEVDLWGRVRAGVKSDRLEAMAVEADYQAAQLSVSGEVVLTWLRMIEAAEQTSLIQEQMITNEKILKLLKARFGSGQSRTSDILRQQQLIESNREQKLIEESRLEVLANQLAVLLGLPPRQQVVYPYQSLPALPELPVTGLPSELLERRPDVRAAYLRLRSADRDIAEAIRDQYPRLSLTAALSTEDDSSVNLFDDWARSFAASLAAPLLDAGRRRAEVERTAAIKDQRLYAYAQSMLTAFREVEDALVQEKKQKELIESLTQQVSLAEETSERLQYEYFNGANNYIDVLSALISEQGLRRDLIEAHLNVLEYRVALYRALAGGFDMRGEQPQ